MRGLLDRVCAMEDQRAKENKRPSDTLCGFGRTVELPAIG